MRISIEPERVNPRQLGNIVDFLRRGEVIVYPTDTVYGVGCNLMDKKAIERVYQIKQKPKRTPLSFICCDLKDIARYAIVNDHAYRLMRRILPGPYTVVLRASKQVPRIMLNKQRTVGIRIPDHPIPLALAEALGNPIITSSIPTPEGLNYNDPIEIEQRYGSQIACVIDSGLLYPEPSTILDLSGDVPRLLREGKGDISQIGTIEIAESLEDID